MGMTISKDLLTLKELAAKCEQLEADLAAARAVLESATIDEDDNPMTVRCRIWTSRAAWQAWQEREK
jgi:hypothetical protein